MRSTNLKWLALALAAPGVALSLAADAAAPAADAPSPSPSPAPAPAGKDSGATGILASGTSFYEPDCLKPSLDGEFPECDPDYLRSGAQACCVGLTCERNPQGPEFRCGNEFESVTSGGDTSKKGGDYDYQSTWDKYFTKSAVSNRAVVQRPPALRIEGRGASLGTSLRALSAALVACVALIAFVYPAYLQR